MNWWTWFTVRSLAVILAVGLSAPASAEKVLRVGVASVLPDRGNPFSSIVLPTLIANLLIYDQLLIFDNDGQLQPSLIESWSMQSPNLWQFKVRDGVQFSNGEIFDAAAASQTITYLAEEAGAMEVVSQSLTDVVAARVIDRLTFEIETAGPNVLLPRRLAGIFVPAPKAWRAMGRTAFSGDPAGTGPFRMVEWAAGKVVFDASPTAWRKPVVDRIELLQIPVLNSRVQALRTGAIDIAVDVGVDDRPLIESSGGTFHVRATGRVQSLTFISNIPSPVADVRVRQALNYAVDKDSIVAVLLGGTTTPAAQTAARQSFGYDETLQPYPYDPDRARTLLAEAGYRDGFEILATYPFGAMAGDAAFYQQVAADLAKVGVTLTIEGSTFSQHISRIRTGGWPGQAFGMDYNNMPALDALWPMRVHSCLWSAPWHCRQDWVPLIKAAETATTIERRLALTQQLAKLYHDEPTAIFLWEMPGMDGVSARVVNFQSRLNAINFETIDVAD